MSANMVDAKTAAELDAIDTAREAAFHRLHDANKRGLTGSDAEIIFAEFADLDRRTSALRRKIWPRYPGRLVVALGTATLVSPTGRSMRLVWQR